MLFIVRFNLHMWCKSLAFSDNVAMSLSLGYIPGKILFRILK